ncbi:universal stress protein [Aequorivita sp. 609]|uniref:universal stress protein n=1 Tax=Aequorivita TaxID=153265 RepID=UPI00161EAA1D|nr:MULTISPECIES: universal stress protein [Aequorivita]MBB6681337.1 universal stress protein [Aequorivita sp. 609]
MHKILIPVDFSNNSMNAAKYAAELFKHGHSEIYLIHAFADRVYNEKLNLPDADFDSLKAKTLSDVEEKLAKMKKDLFAYSPNPKNKIITVAEFGLLVDTVNEWVESKNADIVVMGTQGETDDKNITFGSNTLQVIKYVKCPVLAIPEIYTDVHPKNILFPSDFMIPFKRRELKLLGSIAKCFASKINFLYVSKFNKLSLRQHDNKAFMEACLSENQIDFVQKDKKNVTKAVNKFIIENPIDMLVMVNTRHSYLENILYKSTIEKIGLKIDIPFLVLQNLPR